MSAVVHIGDNARAPEPARCPARLEADVAEVQQLTMARFEQAEKERAVMLAEIAALRARVVALEGSTAQRVAALQTFGDTFEALAECARSLARASADE